MTKEEALAAIDQKIKDNVNNTITDVLEDSGK